MINDGLFLNLVHVRDQTNPQKYKPDDPSYSSIAGIPYCLNSVQDWMNGVRLKLNPDKTEFIIIGGKHGRNSLKSKFPASLLDTEIIPIPIPIPIRLL